MLAGLRPVPSGYERSKSTPLAGLARNNRWKDNSGLPAGMPRGRRFCPDPTPCRPACSQAVGPLQAEKPPNKVCRGSPLRYVRPRANRRNCTSSAEMLRHGERWGSRSHRKSDAMWSASFHRLASHSLAGLGDSRRASYIDPAMHIYRWGFILVRQGLVCLFIAAQPGWHH